MRFSLSLIIVALFTFSYTGIAQVREIVTIAGSSNTGSFGGDGGLADSARLHGPNGVAVDPFGNVFIEDFYNFRVRKVNTLGYISTFAGTGIGGYSGDSSLAPSCEIKPNGVTTDTHGNLYISDNSFGAVRKVNAYTNIITHYAGRINYNGYSGDTGLAVNAEMNGPRGMCFDRKGNLFIADVNNHVIRRVDSLGIMWTFAGNTFPFYAGDLGLARYASLDSPYDVASDKWNNIYIADYRNNVIRKVDTNNVITTVAGNSFIGYTGDNGPAIAATLHGPRGVTVDKNGFIYIADAYNHVIRMVDTFGIITTVAGNGTPGFGGDHGAAIGANLYFPQDVAIDTFLNLYIADADNQRIRKVYVATAGVKNISSAYNLNAYPNPAQNYINIAGLKANDKVAIFNILGTQLTQNWLVSNEAVQTFPLDKLNTGIYLLQVWDGNGNKKAVVRVVKE